MIEYEINPGSSSLSTRSEHEPPPAITRVEIEQWTGDEPIAGVYSTLTDAEHALRTAAFDHLDAVGGSVHALVRVAWADGATHRTTIDLDADSARRDRDLITGHLMRQGGDLADSDDDALRAWGAELRHRLSREDASQSIREWNAWNASLAFIPSRDQPPPPIEAVIVAVGDRLEPPPIETGAAWPTLALADAAIARFVAARRRAIRRGAVQVRVRWADGMVFRYAATVADLAKQPRAIVERMAEHARYIASPAYAERNARTVPRRPLEPQRAWARELLRRVAPGRNARAGGR